MFGITGCTAEAGTGNPSGAPTTPAAPADPSGAAREPIEVRLNPDRVIAGERSSVWVLANCPVPTAGPDLSGTANSDAFLRAVTLDPVPPPTPTATPTGTATGAPLPWVRGEATVSRTADRGTYDVEVRCEGTNDSGTARLRVAAEPSVVPTRAPRAGGGGTAASGPQEESGMNPAGLAIAAVLAGGVAVAVVRRRRS
ncbi:hypothetical protein Misp01_07190 [Microtetraspora sp. NBRC 13810]|uniref:hypothetical protein n=1 Tax=Microtetraspora sp. NBRC 13810 TaxID=3030990 RepID=UPI0024A515FF|nr:hypothetical protein [Microtetraspora sp. NBRC 13810]GLW05589.1 hypothetical protein Misp01_07190 [Microtetraspora sp. NBRC 13810]